MSIAYDHDEPKGTDAEKTAGDAALTVGKQLPEPEGAMENWRTDDEQILPKNNLPLVFCSLLVATFLVCLFTTP